MALVRISKELLDSVKGRICDLRAAEINEVPMPPTEVASTPGDGVEPLAAQILWGEHLHLKSLLPSDWVKKVERVSFTTTYIHDNGRTETTRHVTFKGIEVAVPPNVSLDSGLVVELVYDFVEQAVADEQHPAHNVACKVMAMVKHEKHRRKAVNAWGFRQIQIIEYLNKCKSLNEAIKLWPGVKLYVPQRFIDTVETPSVRSQTVVRKERVLENVDTDGLTAAAIAAKLSGVI